MTATSCEELQRTAEIYRSAGSYRAAANILKVDEATVRRRVQRAAREGILGTAPVLPGFNISKTTAVTDKNGDIVREFVQQRPEPGPEFEMPPGQIVKGVSALVNSEGEVLAKWIKTRLDPGLDVESALLDVFKEYEGCSELPTEPAHTDDELVTVYPIADHHLGMYAWKDESGADYDLKIAEKLLLNSFGQLVTSAPGSKTAIILNLGDFYHSDDTSNRTRKSGHALDVDTRYAKVLRVGVNLMIRAVEFALQWHQYVVVRCIPGNHDPMTALALTIALDCFFRNNYRVTIDTDPSAFWWYRHGKVLLGAAHGDMAKASNMPGIMAARRAKDWGDTLFRYIYMGHVHHKSSGGEENGAIWESFQTLAPRDSYHQSVGYNAGRSMTAITHHCETGEWKRNIVNIRA